MIQIIYASAAAKPFTPEALRLLLSKARSRNALYNVTGMLLYHTGSFLQVLEGPEQGVDFILASILKDPRHTATRTLARRSIDTREFQSWSMAFRDTSADPTTPAGFVDFYRSLQTTNAAHQAHRFLSSFQQGLHRQHVGNSL